MEDKIKKELYVVTPHLHELFYSSPHYVEPVVTKAYTKHDYDEDSDLYLLCDENGEDIAFFSKNHIYHSYEDACKAKVKMIENYKNFLITKENELKDTIRNCEKALNDLLCCKQIINKNQKV